MSKGWIVALIALGIVALLVADRCGSTAAWEKKLADAVAVVKAQRSADSAQYASERARLVADSARADSAGRLASDSVVRAMSERNAALAAAHGAHAATVAAELALAGAANLADTAQKQAVLIVAQKGEIDSLGRVIAADAKAIGQLVKDTLAFQGRLGVSQRETQTERTRAEKAEKERDHLIDVAGNPPKGFDLFGMVVAIKSYLGIGGSYAPITGHFEPTIQAGLSILRAK